MKDNQILELRKLLTMMKFEMNKVKFKPVAIKDWDAGALATVEAVEAMLDLFEMDNPNE